MPTFALAVCVIALAILGEAAPATAKSAADLFAACSSLYDKGDMPAAAKACDQAIIAEPGNADAYFLKGSALYQSGNHVGGKPTVPSGTADTLRRYLELAPDGRYARDAQEMLRAMQQ
jgi:tetratricopeptide (TPR) repeat protein